MRIRLIAILTSLILALPLLSAAADSPACGNVIVPVGVFRGGMYLLGVKDSQVRTKYHGQTAAPSAFVTDNSPKRILFIVDNSARLTTEASQVVAAMMGEFISRGRPVDQMALVTYGGEIIEIPFSTDRKPLSTQLSAWVEKPGAHAASPRDVSKAMKSAWDMFGKPQFGDSVVLFAGGLDATGSATSSRAIDETIGHGIRVFTVLLGAPMGGVYVSTPDITDLPKSSETEPLRQLSERTGGMYMVENTKPSARSYKLSEQRLASLRKTSFQWYGAMHLPYRLEISQPTPDKLEKIEVELAEKQSPEEAKGPNGKEISHPDRVAPCAR